MYDLLTKVFDNQKSYYIFEKIEEARAAFIRSDQLIQDIDYGAGSRKAPSASRTSSQIVGSAVSSPRKCEVLFRLSEQVQPKVTIELGASLGISSAYLASAHRAGRVYSFEGNPALAMTASNLCNGLMLDNIEFITGNFDDVLSAKLDKIQKVDLAYFDGNHRKEPTIRYFKILRSRRARNAVFFIDDIRWSREMYEAWKEIKKDDSVRASVDAFSFGILFFSPVFRKRLDLTITPDRISGGPILR